MDGASDPAVAFAALVTGPPPQLHLDRACALMAAAFTGVDHTDLVMAELDRLASLVAESSLRGVLAAMRGRLVGNRDHYYDPRNSFIDEVVRRGLGLPISLSVVAIEVGRRVDVPIVGIGLPGHFMVRDAAHDVYGDPFHEGAVYDRAGVVTAWNRLVGGGQAFDELFLAPVSERTILIRMLNNLRAVYLRRNDVRAMYGLSVMRGAFAELAHESAEHAHWVRDLN
ncbi:MAG: transglutaminase-like domain-containing protein [Ilumatobacteraceae bacterium]